MQTPGVEPDADDGVDGLELDDFEGDDSETEEVDQLGDGAGEEPEEESEDSATKPQPQPKRPGRRERQTAELRQLRERLERQERELASVRGQQSVQPRVDPADQARRDQAEREQVALYPVEQQLAYWREKDRREIGQALVNQQVQFGETIDRREWTAACRTDKVRQRFADRVEQTLSSERQAGRNHTREEIYYALLGQELDGKRGQASQRQRREGAARVRSQTTQPGGARSDVARERREGDDSLEAARRRIAGRPLW